MSAVVATETLKAFMRKLEREDFANDVIALVGGALDLWLLTKGQDIIYLAKNIGVPLLDFIGLKMPPGLKYESLGQLGMLVAALISG